nr:MAG TPA: hypothetical protein [Caudoviricetes sp.]
MIHIIFGSTPFQVIYTVIRFILVDMVDLWIIFRIRDKGFCYKPMNPLIRVFIGKTYTNYQIPTSIISRGKYSIFPE